MTPPARCEHSFPDQTPLGPLNPGPCRHCGTTYQDAKRQAEAATEQQ